MYKIVHMTSAHPRNDIRIFIKMCSSLAKAGYYVYLVVADNKGYEEKNGVKIFDIGKPTGRLHRMLKTSALVYKRALQLDADVYHLHDPELLPYAYLLKLKGKKVIFDSHEDVPRQILSRHYLNKALLKIISCGFETVENFICKRLDYVIAATPFIRDIFAKSTSHIIDINNFPILGELENNNLEKQNQVCYVGGFTKVRGCYETIEAISFVKNNIKLAFAGEFNNDIDLNILKSKVGWEKLEQKGLLNRVEVKDLVSSSIAGIVTFLPQPNHINSQPNKMFEYMSAGLPVIASNFPLWQEIVEGNKCGICVDPQKPEEIAKAIDYLYEHPEEAKKMGENGHRAVYEKYNWTNEEKKLLEVYEKVIKFI